MLRNGRALGPRLNLWFICGSANGLGAVNGRNADGLGVLEGLLYEVRASFTRDQSPGRRRMHCLRFLDRLRSRQRMAANVYDSHSR